MQPTGWSKKLDRLIEGGARYAFHVFKSHNTTVIVVENYPHLFPLVLPFAGSKEWADRQNERIGLTPEQAMDIVVSSLRAYDLMNFKGEIQ
jgi:hypothetical protein